MTSKAETAVSQNLRVVLASLAIGAPIESSERLRDLHSALEVFLPQELEWRYESFDAFRFAIARKLASDEAEFVGLALLISDQAWTPIHLRLRLSPDSDQVVGIECGVGEPGDGTSGLVRIPYVSVQADNFLLRLPERLESIQWVYRVARGFAAPTNRSCSV